MELHNIVEEVIISRVNEFFAALEEEGNPDKLCLCHQCRMDTICYALNRTPPRYLVSNRGASRVQGETFERQQMEADIATLILEGLKQVNHNLRPNFTHDIERDGANTNSEVPVFNIPTIIGRLFNGNNFAPLSDVYVELHQDGVLVPMKNGNWPNPCLVVSNTDGNFSFWPAAITAAEANERKTFEYALQVAAPGFETLTHFFKIPVASEIQPASSFALDRTFKLPDLYMFPPGEAEKNG